MSEDMNEHTGLRLTQRFRTSSEPPRHRTWIIDKATGVEYAELKSPKKYAKIGDAIITSVNERPALLARVRELEAERDAANARAGAIPSEAEICDIIARNCDDTQVDLLGSAREIIAHIRALREAGK
jgi:hypothetical protein